MSCREIQRGWGSGKGQEICSEERTHSAAAVWPKGAQALQHGTATEHGPVQPLPLLSHGCWLSWGAKALWAQGRDLPPHPIPNCPATPALLSCMHHGGETALISWLRLGVLWLWAVQGRSSPSSPPDQLQATAEGN